MLLRRRSWARLRRLTAREQEILHLLAHGERAAVIAEEASVSLSTVRSQIRSILTKLEVNSQLEAVALLRGEQ
jgi:DNA-binding NarL/FixJ family response regulator